MSTLFHQSYGGAAPSAQPVPATAVATGGANAVAGPNTATKSIPLTGSLSSGGNMIPDMPRNVVVTVTHATSIVALTGVITGVDINGQPLTEAFTTTATGTTKTFTGLKAFKYVTDVSVTAVADATADAITVGTGNTLGCDANVSGAKALLELIDGAIVTTGTLVAGSAAATADLRGTFTPATAPNAAHTYDAWYISDDPWNS
jgi:hypothetical protein